MELNNNLYHQIKTLCSKGETLINDKLHKEALTKFWQAYDLIPNPKTDWEATTWLMAAIGDTNFTMGNFLKGKEALVFSMHCPDAIGNSFLHLRLGQCQFELGNFDRAADELTRAYALEGKELFTGENSKYFDFLKTRIILD